MVTVQSQLENAISVFQRGSLSAAVNAGKKVKGEVKLADYVHIIIVPSEYKAQLIRVIPENLVDRTFCLSHENLDVRQWSEKVYSFVKKWSLN